MSVIKNVFTVLIYFTLNLSSLLLSIIFFSPTIIKLLYRRSVFRYARAHCIRTSMISCSQFVFKLRNITKDGMSIHMDGQLSMFRLRPCPCCIAAGFSPETTRDASAVKTWAIVQILYKYTIYILIYSTKFRYIIRMRNNIIIITAPASAEKRNETISSIFVAAILTS